MGEIAGYSGWAGARLRRRLARRLRADDNRPGPDPVWLAIRTLSQPRSRVDAGLRHRFLSGPARRSDSVRPATLRTRSGGPDHHLRYAAGARGATRCRPRVAD